jgi:hypothetical protein
MKKTTLLIGLLFLGAVTVHAQTPYYQGKTIRIVTGFPAGDVNDTWPRLIGQHMTKYIPGNPTFIVQNMTGAGSMIAANHVYGVAKPDGLTLGWILPSLYFDQLSDVRKLSSTGPNTVGSARRCRVNITCICVPTRRIRPSRIFVKHLSPPNAVPAAPRARVSICRDYSKTHWVSSSLSSPATKEAVPST